jgi:hypothetical protein
MSPLRETIEFISLNDATEIPEGSFQDQLSEMTGWLTIATAAVALNRTRHDIAVRVHTFRFKGQHMASSRRLGTPAQ